MRKITFARAVQILGNSPLINTVSIREVRDGGVVSWVFCRRFRVPTSMSVYLWMLEQGVVTIGEICDRLSEMAESSD